MAKEVESTNEPSQSSSSLPPLGENEVELVIDRFWRDTRPRACVRSETKMVNGFNFRLLVWPQGSKQSQSHLSAFVEVVPVTASDGKKDVDDSSSASKVRPYSPDWACPCVFYRISVMNFKQKYPYSKADTWTFSYVCPDRGWHTLLDTRYINRRDGYLSSEGSLVIRAVAYPRFAHPIPVLPLLANVSHHSYPLIAADASSSSSSPNSSKPGLSNFLATDHVNSLIQSLYHLPGFRRFIYSQIRGGTQKPCLKVEPKLTYVELETIEQGLESCSETIKEIMTRLSGAAPEMFSMIESGFVADCKSGGFCRCDGTSNSTSCMVSKTERLKDIYGRCQVLISCLEESLFSVTQSLLGRKTNMKRTQFDAYRQIVKDCKRILSTVANPLFCHSEAATMTAGQLNLVEELQLLFARMEIGTSVEGALLDTRGVLRELGLTSGGLLSAVSPDGLFVVFYEVLAKAVGQMTSIDEKASPIERLEKLIFGSVKRGDEEELFSHIRLGDSKLTTLDRHVVSWLEPSGMLESPPEILTVQLLNKIKDRLDVPERLRVKSRAGISVGVEDCTVGWDEFLDHDCGECIAEMTTKKKQEITSESQQNEVSYRLHAIQFCWGSDMESGHYSSVVRNHRLGGWTRFDDAYSEELVDIASTVGGADWVFSPEWACSSLLFVREDRVGSLYTRSVDVRLERPDIVALITQDATQGYVEEGSVGQAVLCNRVCPSVAGGSAPASLDPTCQVEVCLVTEKDIIAAAPGGFSIPFSFQASAGARKLIVRKDIQVERLMQAVNEHFKIPVSMQRLFALRYYGETGQERFELMQGGKAVMAYMDPPVKQGSTSSSGKNGTSSQVGNQLYVFVAASRLQQELTVWVKVLCEKTMGMLSVGCLSLDPAKSLRDYFTQVVGKFNSLVKQDHLQIASESQFVVFEEMSTRVVELRKTSQPVMNEKSIMDGDILVFVPLTDAAKRALIGTAAGLGSSTGKLSVKRKTLCAQDETTVEDIEDKEEVDQDRLPATEKLNERCRRFLSRIRDEELDDDYEELLINQITACDESSDEDCTDECCGCKEANRLNARIEVVRQYLRQRDDMKLFDGMTRGELDKLMTVGSKRRLDIPLGLREELASHPTSQRCFYCQLPVSSAVGKSASSKVSCSAKCVSQSVVYHDRCIKELVLENGGSNACIITEGCRGRVVVDPSSVIAKIVNKDEVKMSQAALRSKLTSVLATPPVPQLDKKGRVVVAGKPVAGANVMKNPPPLPSGLRGTKKNTLPVEALWWNACMTAFGGFDNLLAAVVEKHWDAADLALAKTVFTYWCRLLLEKKAPKQTGNPKPAIPAPKIVAQETVKVEEVDEESSESSSESETESEAASQREQESRQLAMMLEETDSEDDGFIVARSGRRAHRARSETPSDTLGTATVNSPTTNVVIPQAFFGAPRETLKVFQTEEDAEEAAASIAHQAIDSLLEEEATSAPISLVDSLVMDELPMTPSLIESRMGLLPASVRQYCLPVDLVFVYYSPQFFGTKDTCANTISLTPPRDEDILETLTHSAYSMIIPVARLFTSPHQTFPDSPITVQWFVEFQSAQDCKQFADFIASSCPEWGPETGALLPASMLGFAV